MVGLQQLGSLVGQALGLGGELGLLPLGLGLVGGQLFTKNDPHAVPQFLGQLDVRMEGFDSLLHGPDQ